MKKISSVALACLFVAGAAQAQQARPAASPWYGEIGYTAAKITSDDATWHPGAVRGVVGYDINPNVAVEGMVGIGAHDDSATVLGVSVEGKIKNSYGLYVKPKFNVTPEVEVFGRVGFARTKVSASAMGSTFTSSDTDLSYGAGVNYSLSRTTYLGVDYMRYYNKDGVKADGLTVGVGMRF